MEKKNTILLTVIAVATLLVAVVGATFAYYSLSQTSNFGTTSANVTTQKPGSIVGNKSTEELVLTLSAVQMSEAEQGVYYAVSKSESSSGTPYSKNTEKKYPIMPVELTPGTEVSQKYQCTATLGVEVTVDADVPAEANAKLVLTPTNVEIKDGGSAFDGTLAISGSEKISKNYSLTYTLGGTSSEKTDASNNGKIDVALSLENLSSEQDSIGNFQVKLTPSDITCTAIAA